MLIKKSLLLVCFTLLSLATACRSTSTSTPERITVVETVEVAVPVKTLQFWSTETQPDRAEATQDILNRFERESGIHVVLTLTHENALPFLIDSAAAAGTLPDVIFHPLDYTIGWAKRGVLDPAATTSILESLGLETFAEGALDLVDLNGNFAAIPSDGWGQLIIYRTDLFEELELEPPTSFERIETAAATIYNADRNIFGITAATTAGEVFTQQTFEHFAVANGCHLVDNAGQITLDTPACVEAVQFYTDLMRNYGPDAAQDVDNTRATYFAGKAGMIVWSPFILDEMAGLRDNVLPTCPACGADPAYLAKNSGIVSAFSGPNGGPAQYGQISSMGVTAAADIEATQQFLEFWFTEAYLDWLSVSVEGKFPMRQGTPDDPTRFIEGWKGLATGVERKAFLADIYDEAVIETLIDSAGRFNRWGFDQGQGALVTAVYEELPVPRYLQDTVNDLYTAEEAVEGMQQAVEAIRGRGVGEIGDR